MVVNMLVIVVRDLFDVTIFLALFCKCFDSHKVEHHLSTGFNAIRKLLTFAASTLLMGN